MVILAMALLQQHDARRDTVIELAVRRRAAIDAQGIQKCGHSEMGAQSGRKNPPACYTFQLSYDWTKVIWVFSLFYGCHFSCWVIAALFLTDTS